MRGNSARNRNDSGSADQLTATEINMDFENCINAFSVFPVSSINITFGDEKLN